MASSCSSDIEAPRLRAFCTMLEIKSIMLPSRRLLFNSGCSTFGAVAEGGCPGGSYTYAWWCLSKGGGGVVQATSSGATSTVGCGGW